MVFPVTLLICVSFVMLAALLITRIKFRHMLKYSEKIPGPKPLPIIGNIFDIGLNPEDVFENLCQIFNQYRPVARIWIGPVLFIGVTEPRHVEAVMNSHAHIRKAFFYNPLIPWLGTGLLTSDGKKWKDHRKMLTPSFHFQILEQFTEVFNRNGDILVRRLSSQANGPGFDIQHYIATCTLDVICESVMGVSVKAQTEGDSEYVRSIGRMGNIATHRTLKPWLHSDTIFSLSTYRSIQNQCLTVLHDMTHSVIRMRRQELLAASGTESTGAKQKDEFGRKRYINFLDLLLQASQNGAVLTDEEIREEVDTFMFEGHDTTSSCCVFTLWSLAKHHDIQDKIVEELREIFGDSDRAATYSDLNKMRYLEQVIKESLRLYPSVPIFGRKITEDIHVDGYVFPAGANIMFVPHCTHRKPEYFPNPEKFDPERFVQENCTGRHPYSYIPFAAGPRNCIGQKFAMLELKSLLSKVLRNYKLYPAEGEGNLKLVAELVLKSHNAIRLKLERRK